MNGTGASVTVITAATPWESRPLARALDLGRRPDDRRLHQGPGLLLVETGMGPERTRAALRELASRFTVRGVIGAGFAGALQPELLCGDIVVDPHDASCDLVDRVRRTATETRARLFLGRLASEPAPLCDPEAKRDLGRRTRATAVDMESSAARSWCVGRGVPFAGIRVILDSLGQRLPGAVLQGDSFAALARYAFASRRELPLLLSLAVQQRRAIRTLGRFLGRLIGENHGLLS